MRGRRRVTAVVAGVVSVALCLGALWWTYDALQRVKLADSDTAGVLSTGLAAVAVVLAVWAWLRPPRGQRDPEVITAELADAVVNREAAQYRKLLGSGVAVPTGRINLTYSASALRVDGIEHTGTLEDVSADYRQLKPGRMVITGAPLVGTAHEADAGTGKSLLALVLLLDLAKDRQEKDPVPIWLSASSWPGSDIRQWLRAHLVEVFNMSSSEAALIVKANLVVPIIDGLDEMQSESAPGYTSRAATLLRALERYEWGGEACPAVVTCRHYEYSELIAAESQLQIAAHIRLDRVDAARARDYLVKRVAATSQGQARWRAVLDALDEVASAGESDSVSAASLALARDLNTPWRLTLAVIVFQEPAPGRDPSELLSLAADGTLYKYLLDRFVPAAVAAPYHGTEQALEYAEDGASSPSWSSKETWRYLAVLAAYLASNARLESATVHRVNRSLSGSDLVLHNLWPLAGTRRVRFVDRILTTLVPLPAIVALLFPHKSGFNFKPIEVVVVTLVALVSVHLIKARAWPQPFRIHFGRLRTRRVRHKFLGTLLLGFGMALVVGVGAGALFGIVHGIVAGMATVFVNGVLEAIQSELVVRPGESVTDPREFVRGDVATWLFYSSGFGFFTGIVTGILSGQLIDMIMASVAGFAFGLYLGLIGGAGRSTIRYLAFLVCVRGQLPWRLGYFLHDCSQLRILRVAGACWQFRHRELQDHLAANLEPPL